jgi:uncharacterized protein YkwD
MSVARRLLPFLLCILTVAATLGIPLATSVAALTPTDDAEAKLVQLLNADRTSRGLPGITVDQRLMSIARARSVDMATQHYFSHTAPDGSQVFSKVTAAGVPSRRTGEIIAYNYTTDFMTSAVEANRQWLASPGHYDIITTAQYTHVGVGLAPDVTDGRRYWTAVWADESGAAVPQPVVTSHYVTVRWTTTFAPRTRGKWSYDQVQRRVNGGHWAWVSTKETDRNARAWWTKGAKNEFRVRMIDTAGRAGAWSAWHLYKG